MKKVYTTALFLLTGLAMSAQVARVPIMEVFSSSTCPPCKPASDVYTPLMEQFHEDFAFVKYPMSWPGAGDPYYMNEFDTRKNLYGVTGVPDIYINGSGVSYSAFDAPYFESYLEDEAYIQMTIKYYVDQAEMNVYWNADFEALGDYTEGEYRLFWSINEKVTYDNATTNGETEFHHICKKLFPDLAGDVGYSFGDTISQGQTYDTAGSFQFVGDYRLPAGAGDAIDLEVENSIEESDDLEMMMWVQDMNTKEVIQAAIGEKVNSLDELGIEGGEEPGPDPTDPKTWPIGFNELAQINFAVYPNPAKDFLNVKLSTAADFTVTMTDLLGKQVFADQMTSTNAAMINVADMPEGVYMIQITTEHQQYFDRVVIK